MCSSRIRGEIVFQKLARENCFRALNPEQKKRPRPLNENKHKKTIDYRILAEKHPSIFLILFRQHKNNLF